MSELRQVTESIDEFFAYHDPRDVEMDTFASFCADALHAKSAVPMLQEVAKSTDLLDEVSQRSYYVTPHFLKLLLVHRQQGWGLRMHVFDPGEDAGEPLVEPMHEHRWELASSVLTGTIRSDNGLVRMLENDENTDQPTFWKYNVADKREVGSIRPVFAGKCVLENGFSMTVPAGTSYAHHSSLAHRLVISEPTVTAVMTSAPTHANATFLEPKELTYEERPTPTPLSPEETVEAVGKALYLMSRQTWQQPRPASYSPLPQLLTTRPQSA